MSAPYSLSEIYDLYQDRKISKREVTRYLRDIAELSDSNTEIKEAISLLAQLANGERELLGFFCDLAVGDQFNGVRLQALRTLILQYPKKAFDTVAFLVEKNHILEFAIKMHDTIISASRDLDDEEYRGTYLRLGGKLEKTLCLKTRATMGTLRSYCQKKEEERRTRRG